MSAAKEIIRDLTTHNKTLVAIDAALQIDIDGLRDRNNYLENRVKELEDMLLFRARLPAALALNPLEERFVAALISSARVNREQAYAAIYGDQLNAPMSKHLLDTHISKIRKKLAGLNISIKTLPGNGWTIEAENDRARLKAMVLS